MPTLILDAIISSFNIQFNWVDESGNLSTFWVPIKTRHQVRPLCQIPLISLSQVEQNNLLQINKHDTMASLSSLQLELGDISCVFPRALTMQSNEKERGFSEDSRI